MNTVTVTERACDVPMMEEKKKEYYTKPWDKQFNNFIQGGKRPGKHPDPDHLWNKDEERYIQQRTGIVDKDGNKIEHTSDDDCY